MANGQHKKEKPEELIVTTYTNTVGEDDVDTPPHHLNTKFKSVQEWLSHICKTDHPYKPISQFKTGLFESKRDYILFLTGVTTYQQNEFHAVTKIEFEPQSMYFRLPKKYYKYLSREQLLNKITDDLVDFTTTQTFSDSFFTKGEIFLFESNGKVIWKKEIP